MSILGSGESLPTHTPTQPVPFLDDVVPSQQALILSDPGSFYDDPYGILAPGVVTNNPYVLTMRDPSPPRVVPDAVSLSPSPGWNVVAPADHYAPGAWFDLPDATPSPASALTPVRTLTPRMPPPPRRLDRYARTLEDAVNLAVAFNPSAFDVVRSARRFRPWYNAEIYADRPPGRSVSPYRGRRDWARVHRGLRRFYDRDEDFEAAEARRRLPYDQEDADLRLLYPEYHTLRLRYRTRSRPY